MFYFDSEPIIVWYNSDYNFHFTMSMKCQDTVFCMANLVISFMCVLVRVNLFMYNNKLNSVVHFQINKEWLVYLMHNHTSTFLDCPTTLSGVYILYVKASFLLQRNLNQAKRKITSKGMQWLNEWNKNLFSIYYPFILKWISTVKMHD